MPLVDPSVADDVISGKTKTSRLTRSRAQLSANAAFWIRSFALRRYRSTKGGDALDKRLTGIVQHLRDFIAVSRDLSSIPGRARFPAVI
jgi:hypothetical protein